MAPSLGRRLLRSVFLLAFGVGAAPTSLAHAAPLVVDQSTWCFPCGSGQGVINDDTFPFQDRDIAQTFVVANDGILTDLEIWGFAQAPFYEGNLLAYIVPMTGGFPETDLSLALDATSLFVDFDGGGDTLRFSGLSVPVSKGDVLAFVLAAELNPGGTVAFVVLAALPEDSEYPIGSLFARQSVSLPSAAVPWLQSPSGADVLFRTYVDCAYESDCVQANDPLPPSPPPDVPEPSVFALLGLALVTAVARRAQGRSRSS
jgi:hypothetical protein